MRNHPLLELTRVRYLEIIREPEALFWAFVFPLLMAAGLGLAFRNQPPQVLKVAVVTAGLAQSVKSEPLLEVQELPADAAAEALRTGKVALVAEPGAGGVVYRYDDTNPEGRTARILADRAVQRAAGRADAVGATDAIMREPGSRYIDFLLSGLLGMNLMNTSIFGLGFTVVDARRRKLMKRLMASPMPRPYYLLSFLMSRLGMLALEVVLVVGFGVLVFGVPMRGSWFALGGVCLAGSLAFSAVGLLLASRARTVEAVSGLMNLVMLPMWIVSGVFFSAQRFPDAIQPVIKALPLTALIDALRANMLQGAGFSQLAPQFGILTVWMVACFALALKIFRWR